MHFTEEQAADIAARLGLDFSKELFDIREFHRGINVELEHGTRDPQTNVTNDDPMVTGKIALAHLREYPDYYTRLDALEKDAEEYWADKK